MRDIQRGCVYEEDLKLFPDLKEVSNITSLTDVSTIIDTYLTIKQNPSPDVDYKRIKGLYEDGRGHYYFSLVNYPTTFDLLTTLNNRTMIDIGVHFTNANLLNLCPLRYSAGVETLRSTSAQSSYIQPTTPAYTDTPAQGFIDPREHRNVVIPRSATPNNPYYVGRNSRKADHVLVGDPNISQCHCALYYRGSDLYLKDVNSKNGTIVNNIRLSPNNERKLSVGDKVKVVSYTLEVV